MKRHYNYVMGFKVNGTAIPDPSVFTGKESDLDSLGNRDANGLLHRKMVATKHPIKLEYHNIDWEMMKTIMGRMSGDEKFRFTFPDPSKAAENFYNTVDAYVGDRDWTCVKAGDDPGEYLGDLSFSIIEY